MKTIEELKAIKDRRTKAFKEKKCEILKQISEVVEELSDCSFEKYLWQDIFREKTQGGMFTTYWQTADLIDIDEDGMYIGYLTTFNGTKQLSTYDSYFDEDSKKYVTDEFLQKLSYAKFIDLVEKIEKAIENAYKMIKEQAEKMEK